LKNHHLKNSHSETYRATLWFSRKTLVFLWFYKRKSMSKYMVGKSTKSYIEWSILCADQSSFRLARINSSFIVISVGSIIWIVYTSFLDIKITVVIEPDRAQNSLQNDVLWACQAPESKTSMINFPTSMRKIPISKLKFTIIILCIEILIRFVLDSSIWHAQSTSFCREFCALSGSITTVILISKKLV
jgi:hypothetical protein